MHAPSVPMRVFSFFSVEWFSLSVTDTNNLLARTDLTENSYGGETFPPPGQFPPTVVARVSISALTEFGLISTVGTRFPAA